MNKCHIKVIPNYKKQLLIAYQNIDKIFTGNLSIKHGKSKKNPSKGGKMLQEKRPLTKLPGVQLRKSMRRIPKETGGKKKNLTVIFG